MSLRITDPNEQLDDLLGTAIAGFDIPDGVYLRAVDRYENLGNWLASYWSGSSTDGLVYPQGSFLLGTVVQPIDPRAHYDIDLVCRRDLLKQSTTQVALKRDVGTGLRQYVATEPDGEPTCKEGKRCWTVEYDREPFHMDVLPAIPNVDIDGNAIWLTDKDLRMWQPSNPIDYASWFHRRMHQEFIQLQERQTIAKRMEVEDVPAWQVKTALQRTVQALKRHRDFYFAKHPENRPASIIITTLAARAYTTGGTLYEVLVDVTAKMSHLVEKRDGVYWVPNPVHPDENFADRWRRHPGRDRHFFDWIEQAHAHFRGLGADRGVDRVLEKLAASFGESPAKRSGEKLGSGLSRARDAGALGMGSAGLLGVATGRSVPKHTFHGDGPSSSAA
jgi:hypothetical protein